MIWNHRVLFGDVLHFLISSCSTRGLHQSWVKLSGILTSRKRSVWRNKKAQKADRFLRGRQIAHLIYDCFRVTGVNESVLDYADLFTVVLRNDDIQEFDTRRDEILLSTEQFPPDDILESLHKLRIRESDQLKTVLEFCDMEIHQKISTPNHQKLKTMVKRCIEQNLRSQNFEAGDGRIASGILVKNQREQRRVHKGQGECWQWKANGQCSKGDKSSFRRDEDKRAKFAPPPAPSPEPSTPQDVRNPARTKSFVCRARIFLKVLVRIHLVKKWHSPECMLHKTKEGCKFWEKCTFTHGQVDYSPAKSLKGMVTKVQWLYWRIHDNRVAYVKLWNRRNLRRFYGRAQKPSYVMQTFETKTHRLE